MSDLDEFHFKARRGQPLGKMFRVRPHLEHQFKRRIEGSIDDELLLAGGFFFQVFGESVPGRVAAGFLDEFAGFLGGFGRGQGHGHVHLRLAVDFGEEDRHAGRGEADRRCRRGRKPVWSVFRLRNSSSCWGNRRHRGRAWCNSNCRPAQILAVGREGKAARSPPLRHLLGIGPGVPDGLNGSIVDPGDSDLVGFIFCGHFSFLSHSFLK